MSKVPESVGTSRSNVRKINLVRFLYLAGLPFLAAFLVASYWLVFRPLNVDIQQVENAANMQDLITLLNEFRADHGVYPKQLEDEEFRKYGGPPHVDSWGRSYYYSTSGADFILASFGRDGKPDSLAFPAMRAQVLTRTQAQRLLTHEQCHSPDVDQIASDLGFYRSCGK